MLKQNQVQLPEDAIIFTPITLMGPDGILNLRNLLKLIRQNFTLAWQIFIAAKNARKTQSYEKIIRTALSIFDIRS